MSELPPLNDLWMLILIAALVFIPIGMRLKAIAARIRRRAAWWCIRPTPAFCVPMGASDPTGCNLLPLPA